jgi:hypothetical protein
MGIKEFIASLEESNFSLSLENGKLNLKGDKNKLTKEEIQAIKNDQAVISYIKANRDELIEYLSVFSAPSPVKKSKDISSIYRLSGLQQGMLFHGLYDEGTEAHKVQFKCDLLNVNPDLFIKSWTYIIKRHSILRTGFYYDAFSVPVQCVYREVKLPVQILDLSQMTEQERSKAVKSYKDRDRVTGFDFKKAPLMRLGLLQLDANRYRMVWTFHHILFDGWSLPIIMEEFLNAYDLLVKAKKW